MLDGVGPLEDLVLEGNTVGPEGAKHLAAAIIRHGSIRTLELEHNEAKDEGLHRRSMFETCAPH